MAPLCATIVKVPLRIIKTFVHDFCSPEPELLENIWVHRVNMSSSKDIQFCLHVRETLPHVDELSGGKKRD